jgi:hypothetical protein
VAAKIAGSPDDATWCALLPQISTTLQNITALLNGSSFGATQFTSYQTLLTNLQTLQTQVAGLNPTPNALIACQDAVNGLLALDIPNAMQGAVSQGSAQLVANGLADNNVDPETFYRQFVEPARGTRLAAHRETPADLYAKVQPTQLVFGIIGFFVEDSLQWTLIQKIYGPVMQQLERMTAILALNGLLQSYLNSATLDGVVTGASQSVQAFAISGSFIEVDGIPSNARPDRYNVWLIGANQIAAAQGVINSFNPSGVKSISDVYKFFKGIVDAIQTAGEAYDQAHQPPDSAVQVSSFGCIFGSASCVDLTYTNGFNSVNTGPLAIGDVIILIYDTDTGSWGQGLFVFAG